MLAYHGKDFPNRREGKSKDMEAISKPMEGKSKLFSSADRAFLVGYVRSGQKSSLFLRPRARRPARRGGLSLRNADNSASSAFQQENAGENLAQGHERESVSLRADWAKHVGR
jgi:hypothetical protein